MNEKYCLYMHVSPDGLRYIGKTMRRPHIRWMCGTRYNGNLDFSAAIEQFGGYSQFRDVFLHYILASDGQWFEWKPGMAYEETNVFTRNDAAALEQKWIALYDTMNPTKGYNRSSGGDVSFQLSEKAKKRNQKAHIGLFTGEYNPFYAKKHTEETRKRLSLYAENRKGNKNPFWGRTHTERTKEKIRKAHTGRYDGEKNPFYGQHHSPETRALLSKKRSKPISMYSPTGQFIHTYPSATAAAEAMGVRISSISACVTKKTKTCCGKIWRYYACDQLPKSELPANHTLCKSISQYDLQGNFIKTYVSLKDAAISVGVSSTAILNTAKGRTKQAGGYIWRYEHLDAL